MPKYILTYFNIRARGEPVRTMLKLAGIEYEEKTIGFGSEQWKKEKQGNVSRVLRFVTNMEIIYALLFETID